MTPTPCTDLKPQPGDFDADLATIDPRFVQTHRGNPNAKVRIVVSIEGEDARRLQRLSAARGEKPTELIAALLREADKPAAKVGAAAFPGPSGVGRVGWALLERPLPKSGAGRQHWRGTLWTVLMISLRSIPSR